MRTQRSLSNAGQLYVCLVALAGSVVVLHSIYSLASEPIGLQWFVLAGLTLLSGSFTIRVPTVPARLSVSETFVFAAAILFGPPAATAIVVLDSLIISLWLQNKSRQFSRVVFNMAAPAISIWVASRAFFVLANIEPLAGAPQPVLSLVAPLLVLALLYFLLNSWLIAIAVGFEKRTSATSVWRNNFLWLSLNYFSGASVAALLLPYLQDARHGSFVRVASILLPLLLISYLTFKTALGRVEDANRHLSELNRLYLSTIETLAMAIDAKDQITHGHIRRVQSYAVKLAVQMGVRDVTQIQAIEAAALLHDMGKLAVPEYILNKPGPLSAAEFERMKLHAAAGADILSAIDFPYPVVPIVRHHHENWDGTGYPDGIAGAHIPIGARILSVVDCFDALTSDRPYRPRLPDNEALRIVVSRRGTMYDPLVVDSFLDLYSGLVRDNPPDDHSEQSLRAIALANVPAPAQEDNATRFCGATQIQAILSLLDAIDGASTRHEIEDDILQHVRTLVRCSLAVFYIHDVERGDLVARSAAGVNSRMVLGLRIRMSDSLSGWVAANRATIRNSDPILDLGEIARGRTPRLHSCMSAVIQFEQTLDGVIALYSDEQDSFTEGDQAIVEAVSHATARLFRASGYALASARPLYDPITTLPILITPQDLSFVAAGARVAADANVLAIVSVRRHDDKANIMTLDCSTLQSVADSIRDSLRPLALMRYGSRRFVALLRGTTFESSGELADRVSQAMVRRGAPRFFQGAIFRVDVSCATSPTDGQSVQELFQAALHRIYVTRSECSPKNTGR